MTLTFLDLYNTAASQEWSMYDSDTVSDNEFEKSLVVDLNKAVTEILYSYPFSFRQRTHVIVTMPNVSSYQIPNGLIIKDKKDNYCVRANSTNLKFLVNPTGLKEEKGIPNGFYIKGSKIIFHPIPAQKTIVTIDYLTLAIGENSKGDEIFALKDDDDVIFVPEHLEEIFKQAVISRCMLKILSAEGDENYSAYKRQSEIAYRLLIKYSNGVSLDKSVKI